MANILGRIIGGVALVGTLALGYYFHESDAAKVKVADYCYQNMSAETRSEYSEGIFYGMDYGFQSDIVREMVDDDLLVLNDKVYITGELLDGLPEDYQYDCIERVIDGASYGMRRDLTLSGLQYLDPDDSLDAFLFLGEKAFENIKEEMKGLGPFFEGLYERLVD